MRSSAFVKEWEKLPRYEKREWKGTTPMRQAGRISGEAVWWRMGLFSLGILG